MSNQPASDRASHGALSLPGVYAGASRASLVKTKQNIACNPNMLSAIDESACKHRLELLK